MDKFTRHPWIWAHKPTSNEWRYIQIPYIGRDNPSHNHLVGPLVWTQSHGAHGDQAHKPKGNEHCLANTFIEVHSFPKTYDIFGRLPTKPYIQVYNPLF